VNIFLNKDAVKQLGKAAVEAVYQAIDDDCSSQITILQNIGGKYGSVGKWIDERIKYLRHVRHHAVWSKRNLAFYQQAADAVERRARDNGLYLFMDSEPDTPGE
jgi:hypothetical protein